MQDQIRNVNNYYNRTRREYNLFWHSSRNLAMHFGYFEKGIKNHDQAVENLNRRLAQLINIKNDDHILDAGSGLGGSAIWLAEHYGSRVLGVNVVKWQNDAARQMAEKKKIANIDFIEADYANTKLQPGSFTVFWGVEAIVHATDKEKVIKEARRLLKPKGRILIAEYILRDKPLIAGEQKIVKRWLEGWAMPSLMTETMYIDYLTKCGFSNIKVTDWTPCVKKSLNRLRYFVWAIRPIKKLLRKINLVDDTQLGDYEASKAQIKALDEGLWRYKVITAVKN